MSRRFDNFPAAYDTKTCTDMTRGDLDLRNDILEECTCQEPPGLSQVWDRLFAIPSGEQKYY